MQPDPNRSRSSLFLQAQKHPPKHKVQEISMTKKRVESQFIAFIQPYLPWIPTTTTTQTNGVMRHTDAFEVDSSMHPQRKPSEIKPHYQAASYRHWISEHTWRARVSVCRLWSGS
jgi:hypothetical protein